VKAPVVQLIGWARHGEGRSPGHGRHDSRWLEPLPPQNNELVSYTFTWLTAYPFPTTPTAALDEHTDDKRGIAFPSHVKV
jgi:hypothetical protein